MNNIQKKTGNELLIASMYMLITITLFWASILALYNNYSLTRIVYIFVYGLAIISIIKAIIERPTFSITTIAISIVLVVWSCLKDERVSRYIFGAENTLEVFALSEFMIYFGLCLPVFLLCSCRIDVDKLKKYMIRGSRFAVLSFCFMMSIYVFVRGRYITNYMSIAYYAVFPIMFLMYKDKEYKPSKLLVMIAAFFILIGGCRGAMVTLMLFVVILNVGSFKSIGQNEVIKLFFYAVFLCLLIFKFEDIMIYINDFLSDYGYHSRILDKIINPQEYGGFSESDGREQIFEYLIGKLAYKPTYLYYDRIVTGMGYAHNFVLEVLCHYGKIIGSLIICLFIYFARSSYKIIKKLNNDFLKHCFFMFLAMMFGQMMVSTTYITNRTFWLLSGILLIPFRLNKETEVDYITQYVKEGV